MLSSDSEHSAEDPGEPVIPGGEVLPGGFMNENVEVPDLQPIPEGNPGEPRPQPPSQDDPEPENPEDNPNQADNMAAQGVQGSQISSIPIFSGIAGLDGAICRGHRPSPRPIRVDGGTNCCCGQNPRRTCHDNLDKRPKSSRNNSWGTGYSQSSRGG